MRLADPSYIVRRGMLLAVALVSITACTARQAYEGVRAGERNKCWSLPQPEQDRCLQRTGDDYDTYQRKREDANKPGAPRTPE